MNSMKSIPEEGLYVSQTDPSIRLVITEVDIVDDEDDYEAKNDDCPFYLITVVREGDEDDMSAPAFEYIPDEWDWVVKKYQLVYASDVPQNLENHSSLAMIREMLSKNKK
ncbi:hypothetical protein [Escherichia coli]|uniref:hypothetical protein n=1 Tax=Escherichia coli TaxID=562 RepID=UPI0032DA8016